MATQGERRRQAVNAVRQLRAAYRKADTAGELVEREADRLVKRKTLISPDSLKTMGERIKAYSIVVEDLQRAYAILQEIISRIPV